MNRRKLLKKAIEARNAAQVVIDGLGGEPGKLVPQTVLEKLELMGLDPKAYAVLFLISHPELTIKEAAEDHLGCNEKTLRRWKKDRFGLLKMSV